MRWWSIAAGMVVVVVAAAAAVTAVVVTRGGDAAAGVTCPGADGRSRELRRCLAESLAFVETPVATGSGVLIADGYVVTNAHVVDPYAAVDVTFDGGRRFDDVPVVGIDAFADIAVAGPIEIDREGLELVPIPDFEQSEEPEVFLVGFPGGVESDSPRVTLSSGLVSRTRRDEAFGHTYLQTDAPISGGQSGGALVDEDGRLLGISGLGFAEEFAMALSTDDVSKAVARIRAGDGDERRTMPSLEAATSEQVTVDLTVDAPSRLLVLPPADEERSVELTIDPDDSLAIEVANEHGEVIALNGAARQQAERSGAWDEQSLQGVAALESSGPGTFAIDVYESETVFVTVRRTTDDAAVTLDADVPFEVFTDIAVGADVTVGDPVRAVLDGFTYETIHPVELTEGDEVDVAVSGGTADLYVVVLAPGQPYDWLQLPDADDGAGLTGLDPVGTFDVGESGTWRIVVGGYDGVVSGYELRVEHR